MRICQVAPELLPVPPTKGGAIERWIRDAAVRLAGLGHDVHVIARDHGDGIGSRVIAGVRYHFVRIPPAIDSGRRAGLFRGLWYYLHVRGLLTRIAPDIVHHHSRPAGMWLSAPPRLTARYVISLHSMDYGWGFGYRAWDRSFFSRGLALASRVLCVSHFIERHTVERYPGVRGVVTTVYNGVDGELFHPGTGDAEPGAGSPAPQAPKPSHLRQGYGGQASPQALKLSSPQAPKPSHLRQGYGGQASPQAPKPSSPQAHTILYVGRIEERKGVKLLVDAFEQSISRRAPDARLLLVGPHSYWDAQPSGYYRTLADRCAANPRIEMRGPTYHDEELSGLYRRAAVSVVPSVFPEALGLTSLEAQASGVPVVVSDSGGLPETVSAGESGIVFENGNVDQLADAIVALLHEEPRRRSMAAAARVWAMARFSWDVIAAQLERIYLESLAQPALGVSK